MKECEFSVSLNKLEALDAIVTEYSLYETGNGRSYYEFNWGEAKIILYESNMMYWVDYEAWNGTSNEMFVRTVSEYDKTADLQSVEKEFAEYMKVKK